ncbi:CHASE domain-containing hybrid sensor histidine kinase/response regulator [Vibrio viridaestus]|uniref:Sensory/regulatory protein RpfC n=1 Tax=Vibrio viridaestus TaxID=2487322 RepID=A0A3N9TL33_9VIBR|nr:response regulator [Vibrio viridaestus]RQW64305.1 response regulator [Vibrio viridaestus]
MPSFSPTKEQLATSFFTPLKVAIAVFLIGLSLTSYVVRYAAETNREAIKEAVQDRANPIFEAISERFKLYIYGLMEARTAVLAGGEQNISKETFNRYGNLIDITSRFIGVKGFGFVAKVEENSEERFLTLAKQENRDFKISELEPHEGDLFVIKYLEPEFYSNNRELIGLDIGSEAFRRSTAIEALKSGKAVITSPSLLADPNPLFKNTMLLFLPLYRGGLTPYNELARFDRGYGWIIAPINLDEALSGFTPDPDKFVFSITDISSDALPITFYRSAAPNGPILKQFAHQKIERLLGRYWNLKIDVTQGFIDSLHLVSVEIIAAFGLILSLLFSSIGYLFVNQKNQQSRLVQEQTKLNAIVECSSDGIIGKTLKGVVVSWNSGAEKIFGFSREEAIGKTLKELIIPERLAYEEDEILGKITQGEGVYAMETLRATKDGRELPVSTSVSPIYSSTGAVIGAAKIVRDISKQKSAEARIRELNTNLEKEVAERTAELAELNIQFSAVLSSASEFSIIATDINGIIRLFNNGAELMSGYKADDVIGKLTPAILYDAGEIEQKGKALSEEFGEKIEGFDVFVYKAKKNITEYQYWEFVTRDGTRFPVRLVVTAMCNDHGEIEGYLGIASNISDQKRAEEELRDAKIAADQANEAKSLFLANMSHEIRTPMNAVLGMLKLLLKTELKPKQKDFAFKAKVAATSLLTLLNDILDYSKIESGKLELDLHPFDLDSLMQHMAVVMTGNLRDKRLEMLFNFDERIPTKLIGDDLRLQQILLNLISNAIKFTEQGEVVIQTKLVELSQNHVVLTISVKDSGIGISKEQQERIFDGFTQAEASITRRFGGTGLGLVISKNLIEMMGGELSVDSELGKGSEFKFTLTLDLNQETEWHQPVIPNHPNILVVDDSKLARTLAVEALCRLEANVKAVSNGKDALEVILSADESDHPYQCVLLDWLMPEMDGVEVAEALADDYQLKHPPKIILISAANHEELPLVSSGMPIDWVLSKPVTPAQLANTVTSVLEGTLITEDEEWVEDDRKRLTGLHILLVEDNAFNQEVAMSLLKAEGATVVLAVDGEESVEFVKSRQHFDLVLMDMQMPRMDGLTATRLIREDTQFDHLPIISMTANVSKEDEAACFNAGMNGHIAKPLDFEQVIDTILRVTSRILEEKERKEKPTLLPHEEALQRFGGNEVLYRKLFENFWDDYQYLISSLNDAVENRRWQDIYNVLHTLKGTSGTVDLKELHELVAHKEQTLKQASENDKFNLVTNLAELIDEQARKEYEIIRKALSGESEEEIVQFKAEVSQEELKQKLDELEELLQKGSLKSLGVAEDVVNSLENTAAESGKELLNSVEQLDFEKAKLVLGKLRERL